jgi:hypothetical protein
MGVWATPIRETHVTIRTLTTAAALGTASILLLSACGGNSSSSSKIQGAESAAPSSAAPSATGPTVKRPVIDLPADLHYTFSPEKTGDAAKDAVLYDNAQFIKATDLAIAHQAPSDPAYRFYAEGAAAAATEEWVKGFVQYKQRTTGTLQVFNRQVDVSSNGTAELTYCTNEGKAYNKELSSGKVDVTPVTKNSYVLYGMTLRKNAKGIWMAETMHSTRGASQCQP